MIYIVNKSSGKYECQSNAYPKKRYGSQTAVSPQIYKIYDQGKNKQDGQYTVQNLCSNTLGCLGFFKFPQLEHNINGQKFKLIEYAEFDELYPIKDYYIYEFKINGEETDEED